jgi:hypothetical protein
MTDQKRTRRDIVRELGEEVIAAIVERLTADIAKGNIELPSLIEALTPSMEEIAKRVAASPDFQKAMQERMTMSLFPPRITASPQAPAAPEPHPNAASSGDALQKCSLGDCERYGHIAWQTCGRKECPMNPGAADGAE